MLETFRVDGAHIEPCPSIQDDCWIRVFDPTDEEIDLIGASCNLSERVIRSALDDEELSRVERFGDDLIIVLDIPFAEVRNRTEAFMTLPLAIIVSTKYLITLSMRENPEVYDIMQTMAEERGDDLEKGSQSLVLTLFLSIAALYQHHLRDTETQRREMERNISRKTSDADLIKLHELETDLVYFETSLRTNKTVLERIMSSDEIKTSKADHGLMAEVLLETNQDIEMATIYRSIIGSTRDLFKSVLDNTRNTVMKILTGLTVILAVPTIISGFYGMNVPSTGMPFGTWEHGFGLICAITLILCLVIGIWLHRRDLF